MSISVAFLNTKFLVSNKKAHVYKCRTVILSIQYAVNTTHAYRIVYWTAKKSIVAVEASVKLIEAEK
jgi:hypothetical protein